MTQNANQSILSAHPENHSQQSADFPIVGIGASAGGLEAFEQFFRHIPADTGMAFVLISHLDPSHASILTEILQRITTMPVVEAEDQMQVKPNCVYVIPPNRDMTIFHSALQLSLPEVPHGQRMPIDTFLRSLAEDQAEKSFGIILSGTGTDGTLGLRAILGAGGVTLAQEPTTAKFDGMPVSAIQSGYVTHILPVEKMPEILLNGLHTLASSPVAPPLSALSGINHILMQLRTSTGHDFSLYKKSTITRRIQRRMSQNGIEDTEAYARYLKEHPAEVASLFKELLINVTSFFRDPEAFTALKDEILPALLKDKPQDYVFRVWVAGCATGEEAYSIAIVLLELMDKNQHALKTQIYSTDLADDTIAFARTGLYPPNIAIDVSPERLRRFFIKDDAGYRVKKEIREMVVFAVQNVVKDPPFTNLDLLSCRNLMIYLEPELQNRLIPAFRYSLKPGGVLFLSPSESIGNHTELFTPLNRKWKFYRAAPRPDSIRTILTSNLNWTADLGHKTPADIMKSATENKNLAELTRRMLLQFYAPTSVLTDLKGNILYIYGDTGNYLRPAPGHATLNIIDMAREGLQMELRSAISSASEDTPTLNREISVKTNGDFHPVRLSARPLVNPNDQQKLLMVSFHDLPHPASGKSPTIKRKRNSKQDELHHIEELERELAYTKENLQATIEEQFASNEELKCTNEEMQSTNEELQSTNEELETSKEELQSINEELVTVNSELQSKIVQLADVQNDMKNLLDNIHIGIIFLDLNLIIRRFTRAATQIYRLVGSDVGRALSDIKPDLESKDDLLDAAHTVLDNLAPIEREVKTISGHWYLARIQPYRTLENMIDGVVLTFTNITERVRSIAIQEARLLAESIVNTVREPLIVLNKDLKVVTASRSFYQIFQVSAEETVSHHIYELGDGQWDIPALRNLLENVLSNNQAFDDYRVALDFPTIGHRIILLNARSVISQSGEPQLILLAMDNITDKA